MTATQAIVSTALSGAIGAYGTRLPLPSHPDPKIDGALKAAAGLALVALAYKSKGWGRTIMIGAGGGFVTAGIRIAGGV